MSSGSFEEGLEEIKYGCIGIVVFLVIILFISWAIMTSNNATSPCDPSTAGILGCP